MAAISCRALLGLVVIKHIALRKHQNCEAGRGKLMKQVLTNELT